MYILTETWQSKTSQTALMRRKLSSPLSASPLLKSKDAASAEVSNDADLILSNLD